MDEVPHELVENPAVRSMQAQLAVDRGDLQIAESIYRSLLKEARLNRDAQLVTNIATALAEVMFRQNDYTSAISLLEEVTRDTPSVAQCWFRLGQAYQGQGRLSEARLSYQKALELDANYTAVAQALRELEKWCMSRICIVPGKLQGIGGPASFQRKLATGLAQRGTGVTYDLDDLPFDSVLVINGTQELGRLWRLKRRGVRIVQRLGGINWLHRYLRVGLHGYMLAEARNVIMSLIRARIADHIVYQSYFVKDWWNRRCGDAGKPCSIIYNGVDLAQFNSEGPRYQSEADICIISVEGTQGADPFDIAIQLGLGLERRGKKVELLILGKPWNNAQSRFAQYPFVRFMGQVPNSQLPYYYRSAMFYLSTDILTAACPNSVLEALACGTPVLGYKAGVLPELLEESAGRCVDVQGDPWKGEAPGNVEGLVSAAFELSENANEFRRAARRLAEQRYCLAKMVDSYVRVLQG